MTQLTLELEPLRPPPSRPRAQRTYRWPDRAGAPSTACTVDQLALATGLGKSQVVAASVRLAAVVVNAAGPGALAAAADPRIAEAAARMVGEMIGGIADGGRRQGREEEAQGGRPRGPEGRRRTVHKEGQDVPSRRRLRRCVAVLPE